MLRMHLLVLIQRVAQLLDPRLVFFLLPFVVKSVSESLQSLPRPVPRIPHNIAGWNGILDKSHASSSADSS